MANAHINYMQIFTQLTDMMLFYDFGIREYEGQSYITLENDMADAVFSNEHLRLLDKAVIELLLIPPEQAYRLVRRFVNIFTELERDFFKVRDYSSESTLEQFELICSMRGVIIERSVWRVESLVSTNFINALENDIWARHYTFERIEDALKSAINNELPKSESIFMEEGAIDNLPIRPETSVYIDWTLWDKIEKGRLLKKETEETSTVINSFSSFLTAEGKRTIDRIQAHYHGARPVNLFAVFYAMSELGLIADDKKALVKFTRKQVAQVLSETFGVNLSTQIVGNNINEYDRNIASRIERVRQAKEAIKRLISFPDDFRKFSEKS